VESVKLDLCSVVVRRLLYAGSHVKGHPAAGSTGAGGQLTAVYMLGQRHLLDDSILEQSPCASSQNSLHAAGRHYWAASNT